MDREILLVVDPMCSWCWGFSPTVTAIQEAYADQAPIFPIVGGLRPLSTDPMNDRAKEEIRHHWDSVQKASGQPFDFTFFDRDNFVYDTEPACRALVTVRFLKPTVSLGFLTSMHQAFYAENQDITDHEVLADLAEKAGVSRDDFVEFFPSRKMIYLTASDFYRSQSMGVSGFPTVILRANEKLSLLSAGFRPFEDLKPHLDQWLESGPEEGAVETEAL
ncbi:MAG: DsbA family protein [Rhodospirillales bacterium]|nr:DsbA family protein [Alphaproteobacteria bacterium]MBL6948446.1 DsbA family protein [Rhodospirillales bacterium]